MRKYIISAFVLFISFTALAHEGVEIGPSGGRLIEFADAEGLHAEVTLKGDMFVVGLYDETNKKVVPAGDNTLVVTHGDRSNPQKLAVEKKADGFVVPKPPGDDFWLIIQVKPVGGKTKTARLHYEAKICEECNKPEWLCGCGGDEPAAKK
jgi:hypothetical protein